MQLSERIIEIFREIARVPRQSKHEEKIAAWLVERAQKDGFEVERDANNNVVIRVPASVGYEHCPILVLQGHMDMVCEKTPTSTHNFATDPIEVIIKDGWMQANGTTLGADDGLGVATALALVEDETVEHPPIEILITSDEETGMTGACALRAEQLKGRILVNLDSEDEGVLTVGCTGGRETKSKLSLHRKPLMLDARGVRIHISGLLGGHSGTDIHCGRANAIKLATRIMQDVIRMTYNPQLVDLKAGSAHNAIPRDAVFTVAVSDVDVDKVVRRVEELSKIFASEYAKTDSGIVVTAEVCDVSGNAYDYSSFCKVADVLLAFPHGVAAMSQDIEGLVETSVNLAAVRIADDTLRILSSQRSSIPSKLDAVTNRIASCMRLAGGSSLSNAGYPGWKPDMDSDLLKRLVTLYERRFCRKPVVDIIHAGLECGIIGDKIPGMQMVSLGATVVSPHSPLERAKVDTIPMIADLMVDLFKSYK